MAYAVKLCWHMNRVFQECRGARVICGHPTFRFRRLAEGEPKRGEGRAKAKSLASGGWAALANLLRGQPQTLYGNGSTKYTLPLPSATQPLLPLGKFTFHHQSSSSQYGPSVIVTSPPSGIELTLSAFVPGADRTFKGNPSVKATLAVVPVFRRMAGAELHSSLICA